MLIDISVIGALLIWHNKHVQIAARWFFKKVWPRVDTYLRDFWIKKGVPAYAKLRNIFYKVKKLIKIAAIRSKKALFFLTWMFSSLQNIVLTLKTIFKYGFELTGLNRLINLNYTINFLVFYIKSISEHFYFFKWSSLSIATYIFIGITNYLNKFFKKNWVVDPTISFTNQSFLIQWAFFNFFKKGNYLYEMGIMDSFDLQNLISKRKLSKKFPCNFNIAFEHSLITQRSQFKKVSINSLKKTYKNYQNKVVQFADMLKLINTYENSSGLLDGGTSIIISFLFFYKFTFKKPVVLLNFIKTDYFFNRFHKCGDEMPTLPLDLFNCLNLKHLKEEYQGDDFIVRYINYVIPTMLDLRVLYQPFKHSSKRLPNSWKKILINKRVVHQTNDERILKKMLEIVLNNIYDNTQSYRTFYEKRSFYFREYYDHVMTYMPKPNPNEPNFVIFKPKDRSPNDYPVEVNPTFKNFLAYYWPTRFNPSTFYKFNDLTNNADNTNMFLRKNKIFNKSRYSRNRQIYRTGVYLCLYINIIFVYFYVFSFYRFAFVFGYFWLGIGLFIISATLGRAMKYRLYNPIIFYNELLVFKTWSGHLLYDIWDFSKGFISKKIKTLLIRSTIVFNINNIFPDIEEETKNSPEKQKENIINLESKITKYFRIQPFFLIEMSFNTTKNFEPLWSLLRWRISLRRRNQKIFYKKKALKDNVLRFYLKYVRDRFFSE